MLNPISRVLRFFAANQSQIRTVVDFGLATAVLRAQIPDRTTFQNHEAKFFSTHVSGRTPPCLRHSSRSRSR